MKFLVFVTAAFALHVSAWIQSPLKISKQPPTDELLFQVTQQIRNDNDAPYRIECQDEGEPTPDGPSFASPHSRVCTIQHDVPYKNPDNVMGNGTDPQNIVISWTVMPQIQHNAPNFMYRVSYRRDIPGENWTQKDIHDWKIHELQVDDQPTYERYEIKVMALNEKGESSIKPNIVIGYSGEDQPTEAPNNFTIIKIISSTSTELSWNPVPESSVRGELRGYKIQTWTERDGEEGTREINVGNQTRVIFEKFVPYSKNYVKVLAFNGRYNGPSSKVLSFDTPEGKPGTILSLEALPIASSALWLKWTRPAEINGILTGYRIYYQVVDETATGPLLERQPRVLNPKATSAKLANLAPNTNYRVHVEATTRIGEGDDFYIEERTRQSQMPDLPHFTWETFPKGKGLSNIKITWIPNLYGYPGSHFYAKYKLKEETIWRETDPEFQSNNIEICGLSSDESYIVSVVAVDGNYTMESEQQNIETISEEWTQPKENYFKARRFTGLLLMAIAFLLIVLIIVRVVKIHQDEEYAVHEPQLPVDCGSWYPVILNISWNFAYPGWPNSIEHRAQLI